MNPVSPLSDRPFPNQEASSSSLCVLEEFTQSDIDGLYSLYLGTYSKLEGSNYLPKAFSDKFPNYYDICYYEKGPEGKIKNAYLCNRKDNENGIKICLVFGENTKEAGATRIAKIKELLMSADLNLYLEASGPLAAVLLKDPEIPVALVTEKGEFIERKVNEQNEVTETKHSRSHYAQVKTGHGKKIVFGHPKKAGEVSGNMKKFYFYLYEYNKVKMKLEDFEKNIKLTERKNELDERNNIIDASVQSLDNLFEKIQTSEVPLIFKSILLSRISKKSKELKPDSKKNENQQVKVMELLDGVSFEELIKGNIFANGALSADQKAFLEEMLGGKHKVLQERHLFKA